jgi:hypothetical protein
MKALRALLIPAVAAWGLAAAVDAPAQTTSGATRSMPSGGASGSMQRHWSGSHRGTGTWSGSHHRGTWSGGRHWSGHHHHRHFGYWPSVGFYFGVPLAFGYWGSPYFYDYYYAPRTVIYHREVERVPYEGEMAPSTTEAAPGPGAPTQGPLYMNYCESAKAYYPKVASCPEGWKFIQPQQ